MDEDLKKALLDTLNDARSAAEQGKDFVLEQAPRVVQEYIAYMRIESTILSALLALWVVAVLVAWVVVFRRGPYWSANATGESTPSAGDYAFVRGLGSFLAICFLIMGGLLGGKSVSTCIKAWVAPRVLIIEKAADLIK